MQQKQLPPNPSLEHLKSQAKQLLKAHNEGSLDAFRRIRSFFPKLADATDVEIQNAAFGLQDAQLVVAREYGFASWTQLKTEVLHQEQRAEKTLPKDLLFQILRTPDPTQAHIQRVEDLLTADPSLVSVADEDGRTPIEALASRGLINFGEALLEAGADVHRSYRVDMDGEVLELTPLTYTQKLASMFPDKPFDRVLEVLGSADVGVLLM